MFCQDRLRVLKFKCPNMLKIFVTLNFDIRQNSNNMVEIITARYYTDILYPLLAITSLLFQLQITFQTYNTALRIIQIQPHYLHTFIGQYQHLVTPLGVREYLFELYVLQGVLDLVGVHELVVGQVVHVHDVPAVVICGGLDLRV